MRRYSAEDIFVDSVVYLILAIVFIATVYPFYYCLVISFNEGIDASTGGIFLWPRRFTLENYEMVFSNEQLMSGFLVSVLRTVTGTILSLLFTGLFAYGLAYKNLMFKKTYIGIMIFAMYFSGGLIPYYVLLKNLRLLNTFWVYIIPALLSPFNAIIMMSFFREIPDSIEESVKIDGANDLVTFFRIIVPISTPVFATIALFNGVGHWNSWFDTAFFTTDRKLRTLSFLLKEIINRANLTSMLGPGMSDAERSATYAARSYTAETIRMATMMLVVIPIICIYPFLQRYFVKGIMIGSIKG
ncbi:MAG: carbohydrate ABC transporter permease [Clostridiales bacterium]|nr:carbohydrate ABC transporter permease [Clostridiales bacterium]